jgi:hypothetical protein
MIYILCARADLKKLEKWFYRFYKLMKVPFAGGVSGEKYALIYIFKFNVTS